MRARARLAALGGALLLASAPVIGARVAQGRDVPAAVAEPDVLWTAPTNLEARDLLSGPGGRNDAPSGALTFIKEDLSGTSPKFDARDENGVRWRVKLGPEARPETVACRMLWAVGYFASEDYFLSEVRVEGLPRHLRRGERYVEAGGIVRDVRLKRHVAEETKVGDWRWKRNPFSGTRELNGLRVMMALINNWDLKDDNNALYERSGGGASERLYLVSDVGASFGSAGLGSSSARSKGNLKSYERSAFIRRIHDGQVDFACPAGPTPLLIIRPRELCARRHLRWIGRRVPIEDARWIGGLLARLSPQQIRDAFRAAGYGPGEVEGFAHVVERRIAALGAL